MCPNGSAIPSSWSLGLMDFRFLILVSITALTGCGIIDDPMGSPLDLPRNLDVDGCYVDEDGHEVFAFRDGFVETANMLAQRVPYEYEWSDIWSSVRVTPALGLFERREGLQLEIVDEPQRWLPIAPAIMAPLESADLQIQTGIEDELSTILLFRISREQCQFEVEGVN